MAAKKKPAKKPAAKRTGGRTDTMARDVVLRAFAVAYLRYGNATRAYREAVPNSQANDNTAAKEGHYLLYDERTQRYIDELRKRAAARAEATLAEWIANELRVTRFDIARIYDENGNVLPMAEIDADTRYAIQGVDVEEEKVEVRKAGESTEIVTRTRLKRIRIQSKDGAQDRLGKHLGAYLRDNEQKSATYEEVLRALHGEPDNR